MAPPGRAEGRGLRARGAEGAAPPAGAAGGGGAARRSPRAEPGEDAGGATVTHARARAHAGGAPHPRPHGRDAPRSTRPARLSPPAAAARAASGTAGRRGSRAARPFDVRRRRGDWPGACDVRGLRWARGLRQPQRPPRLELRLPGI